MRCRGEAYFYHTVQEDLRLTEKVENEKTHFLQRFFAEFTKVEYS